MPDQPGAVPPRGPAVLRQARAVRTRQELVATAIRLWRPREFDDLTVDTITEAAGVSKGTFYYHFRRKEDLLVELGWTTVDRVGEEAEAAHEAGASLDEAVDVAIAGIVRRVAKMPRGAAVRTIKEYTYTPPTVEGTSVGGRGGFLSGLLRRAQDAGEVAASVDTDELATVANQVIIRTILEGFSRGDLDWLEPAMRRRVRLVLYGMDVAYPPAGAEAQPPGAAPTSRPRRLRPVVS